jgi:hypothetical protein
VQIVGARSSCLISLLDLAVDKPAHVRLQILTQAVGVLHLVPISAHFPASEILLWDEKPSQFNLPSSTRYLSVSRASDQRWNKHRRNPDFSDTFHNQKHKSWKNIGIR